LLLAPAGGLTVTAPAMVGQNLGAGQPARAARAVKLITAATGVSGALLLGLLILFARPAYAAFTSDQATITMGVQVIGVLALYRLLLLLSTVLDGALTGAGDTVSPMVVNFIAQFGVLLPAVWLLSTVVGWGVQGIFWALVIGFGVQTLLLVLRFRQGRWQSVRI
jgi:Na+-driven multidrug efflux pump